MVNICKCNKCDTLLYDENAQIGGKLYDESKFNLEQMIKIDDRNDNSYYWACPHCETDSYLVDFTKKSVSSYTNSVQHNVIATAIKTLNDNNGLTYIRRGETQGESIFITKPKVKLSVLHSMSEILNEIHKLGYQIIKKPLKHK